MYYIELEGSHIADFARNEDGTVLCYGNADDACHQALASWDAEKRGIGLGADTIQVVEPLGNDEYRVIKTYLTSEDY